MNFQDYRATTNETAVYPKEKEELYLALGLMSEVAEIAGKLKKVIRDNNGDFTADNMIQIEKECGDVYWYLAQIANMIFEPDEDALELVYTGNFEGDIYQTLDEVFYFSATLYKCLLCHYYGTNEMLAEQRKIVFSQVMHFFETFVMKLGLSARMARQKNINKLFDRKERGVIQGSGDDR